jgi:hypothetical protein
MPASVFLLIFKNFRASIRRVSTHSVAKKAKMLEIYKSMEIMHQKRYYSVELNR